MDNEKNNYNRQAVQRPGPIDCCREQQRFVRLYRPHPKDWYGETKRYLYRVRDGWRRVEMLRRRCEERRDTSGALDTSDSPDAVISPDELHKKLDRAEQDMKIVTGEVIALLGELQNPNQRTVMTRRYINDESWKQIADATGLPISEVVELHQTALPILKRALKKRTVRCRDNDMIASLPYREHF